VPTARELLADAAQELRAAGVPTPEVDAELLLAHVTGRPRALLRLAGDPVAPEQADRFAALIRERTNRIPLQHLTGRAPFRHLDLQVGRGVFVPRPETELMVDAALAHLAGRVNGALAVDLCTGSGALALALATEAPGCVIHAVELSADAATWARRNLAEHATRLALAGSSVTIIEADATTAAEPRGPLAAWRGQVDVVMTNPPYVPDGAVPREPEVRDHDPGMALFGGPHGLDLIGPLAVQAALLLRPGGLLLVEHADLQGEAASDLGVPALLRRQPDPFDHPAGPDHPAPQVDQLTDGTVPAGDVVTKVHTAWRDVTDHLDLAGRPRFTSAIRAAGRMAP
jgi:release factor glutamine methyltransferase